jgi:hypothetical protein
MPINSFLYPGAKVVPPFTVANSVRLNQGDDPDMKKTIGAPTSARKFSVSCWVKLSNLGVQRNLWGLGATSGATGLSVRFQDDDTLDFFDYNGSGNNFGYSTNQFFRDPSAWSHFLFAVDTEQSTAHNRVRIYHNGTEIEKTNLTDNPGDPSQNADLTIADGHTFKVGDDNAGANEWAGYIAEFVYIDGLQLTPSSFGQFNDDSPTIWEPIDVTGLTFGNNGFYLDFEDSSNLGNDVNGGTDLTETNIASTDQSTDTCSNNYAVLNPLLLHDTAQFSEGNLKITQSSTDSDGIRATIGVRTGKWYWEVLNGGGNNSPGIATGSAITTDYIGADANGFSYFINGQKYTGGSASSYGASFTTGDIIGHALDMDNNQITFYKNGSSQGVAFTNLPDEFIFPAISTSSVSSVTSTSNFGQDGSFAGAKTAQGNSDANGYGNFYYSVPSGYYAINSKNLAEFG